MASLIDLTSAIDTLLSIPAARSRLKLNRNTEDSAYEVYIFSLCVEAVKKAGGTVELRGINSGKNPNPIVFRGSPGSIHSRAQNFAYAYCEMNSKKFELHIDVQFIGSSTANHEIDVSIVDHASASRCRTRKTFPNMAGHLIGAIECKYYSGNPGVYLARTFAGLISDSSTNRINAFVYNRESLDVEAFHSKKKSAYSFKNLTPLKKAPEDLFISYVSQEMSRWSSRR